MKRKLDTTNRPESVHDTQPFAKYGYFVAATSMTNKESVSAMPDKSKNQPGKVLCI